MTYDPYSDPAFHKQYDKIELSHAKGEIMGRYYTNEDMIYDVQLEDGSYIQTSHKVLELAKSFNEFERVIHGVGKECEGYLD